MRPGKRLKPGAGAVVDFTNAAGDVVLSAEIIDWARDGQRGERVARLSTTLPSLDEALHAVGHTPVSYTHLDVYKRQHHGCSWKSDS